MPGEVHSMRRQIFTEEHDAFRDMVRAFIAKEITPYHEQWERDGIVSRDVWLAAGRAGLLGIHLDEKYGGGGQPDYRFYVILNEELARAGASGPMFQLHNDMIGPYLDRLGMHAQDTSELFFTDVEVPAANLLGEEGGGFVALMQNLPRERLTIGVTALAIAEQAFADTLAYSKQRSAFGQPVGKFQHNRFTLAEMATEIAVAREFTDRAITEHCAGRLTNDEAAMVKWWNTELCNRVTDRCVQLHGGYGYMREYAVGRAWTDRRVQSIFRCP